MDANANERKGQTLWRSTTGGCFAGKTVTLAEGAPEWVKRVYVGEDGDIYLKVKYKGFMILVK